MREKLEKLLENSYAPYSNMHFACIVETKNGNFYEGVNIENASYSISNCAERTAFFKAVYDGRCDFEAIAIVGGSEGKNNLEYCPPCGVCRQVMREFCNPKSFKIILAKSDNEFKSYTLEQLLPESFGPNNLH